MLCIPNIRQREHDSCLSMCSARYRIDKSKIRGRGAKITCPRCANKFVVYTEQETKDITQQDFSSFGITWRVKKGLGVIQSFSTLAELKRLLDTNEVNSNDTLCYDNKTWIPLHSVENLDGFFAEVWKRAEKGEVKLYDAPEEAAPIDDEFDSPTMVMKDRDKLLSELRKELSGSKTPVRRHPCIVHEVVRRNRCILMTNVDRVHRLQ